MDRITNALVSEFLEQQSLQKLNSSKAFEHFSGYLCVSKHHAEEFSTGDIVVGDGADCGIDSIATIANGVLIQEANEVAELAETNGYLDVTFVLVQSETSSSFETAKIGQFGFGVQDFFSENPKLPQNEKVKHAQDIANEVFARSSKFRHGNPRCFLYYVTTGVWTDDVALVTRRDAERADIYKLGLFRSLEFTCMGAESLQALYQNTKNAASVEIDFPHKTALPAIAGVEQAYIGFLSGPEYLKLLRNGETDINASLFFDNVRHWQQWNPVNKEIKATLDDPVEKYRFPLMNNGVTIVAKRIQSTANRFLVEDYQIVNGCQTSFVLHECDGTVDENVIVPVRLIATLNSDIRNAIIKGTNRQTEVEEDQLFALSEFPRKLEAFFPTFEGKQKLYYERRSRQYNQTSGIEKVRILDMRSVVRSFASMFLDLPHRTTRNYRSLTNLVGKQIFNKNHKLEPYYTAAYASFKLEFLFRNQFLHSFLKPTRYHILMAMRYQFSTDPLPAMNSHAMTRLCNEINNLLWDDDAALALIHTAWTKVAEVAEGNFDRDNIRTEEFTTALLTNLAR